jgi:acyl-coenzyme A synthetase/AMP-(fatty) acid ligase
MNIYEPIREQARRRPAAAAVVRGRRTMTYAQLDAATQRIALALAAQGLEPGATVGTCMLSSSLYLLVTLALARLGAMVVPLHPHLPPAQRKAIADHLGVAVVLAREKRLALPGIGLVVIDRAWAEAKQAAGDGFQDFAGGENPFRISLSSGTTGLPKAIVRTHARALQAVHQLNRERNIGQEARYLCRMDLNTGVALNDALRYLCAGARLVFAAGKDVTHVFEAIERHQVTHAYTSPVMLERWVDALPAGRQRFPSLTRLTVSGGRLREPLRQEIVGRLTPCIFVNYGMSEVGSVADADPGMLERFPECVGRTHSWLELEITDEDDRPVPAGETGIVRVRGAGVAQGYYRNPGATRKAFRDGWFYSNDFGRLNREGILAIESRLDDVINLGGVKVDPARIENVLASHPDVIEVAVFDAPSEIGGTVLGAAVVTREVFNEQVLLEFCRDRLGKHAPQRIFAVREMPRNPMGKIVRRDLTQQFAQASAGAAGSRASSGD